MPVNKDFALRIELIDECLRNRYRNWTLHDILCTVNDKLHHCYGKTTSKRTIQEDIRYLKEEKQAPIEKKRLGATVYFYYSDPNFSIKNLPIGEEEITFLVDAINILRGVSDFKILKEVDGIIEKLQNTVQINREEGRSIIQFEKHTNVKGTEYIDDLFEAIKVRLPLRITYQSFKEEKPGQFIFHPYLLKEYRNRWFLIGRINDNKFTTTLALDRIKEIKPFNSLFLLNDLFNSESYFNNLIGVTIPEGESIQEITIKVSSSLAPYIRTKPIHQSQQILNEYKGGGVLIKLRLIINYELHSVLLGYGADVEVLKPGSLRNSLKDAFKKGLELYA